MNIQEAEVKITRSQSEKGQWKLREEGGRLKLALLVWQLDFFDQVITPVALFGSGHRTIRMSDLYKLDVVCRKMLRMVVGPPNFVEWNASWHDILHHWKG